MDLEEKAKALLAVLDERLQALSKINADAGRLGDAITGESYRRWKDATTKLVRDRVSDAEAEEFSAVRAVIRFRGRHEPPWWVKDGRQALAFLTALIKDLKERPQDVLEVDGVAGEQRQSAAGSGIRLFVSHASADAALAENVIKLLRSALNLQPQVIRCTSVEGYRLPVGADTDDTIRDEVLRADVVLGIISTASLESLYVAFELGARWGAGRDVSPLLAPGVNPSVIKGPLGGKNALRADSNAQLHQLVNDLGKKLGITPNAPASYQSQIDEILALAPAPPGATKQSTVALDSIDSIARFPDASDEDLRLLDALGKHDGEVGPSDLQAALKISPGKAEFILETLEKRGLLVGAHFWTGAESRYSLSAAGRALLARLGRL